MFDLQFENLRDDGSAAHRAYERQSRAAVSPEVLVSILERFASIDPVQNVDAEPQLAVRGSAGRFLLRTQRRKLLLCSMDEGTRVWVEVTPAEVVEIAGGHRSAPHGDGPETEIALPKTRRRWPAVALLLIGVSLNTWVLWRVLVATPAPDFVPEPLADSSTEFARQIRGDYIAPAGPDLAFQRISIEEPNVITFYRYADGLNRLRNTDLYLIGRYNGKPRLITGQNGFVDAPEQSALEHSGTRYERRGQRTETR